MKQEELAELYRGCRTYRRFTQDAVPHDVICAAIEEARCANCAMNAQSLRYVVVEDPVMVARMQPLVSWAGALPPEIGHPHPDECPKAFIVMYTMPGASAYSDIDAGIAADRIISTVWSAGVGSCLLGSVRKQETAHLLELPGDAKIVVAIALGYPAHTSQIAEVPADGCLAYYVDEQRNYYVPKLPLAKIVRFI